MEQAQYWMRVRRHDFLKSHFQVSMNTFNDSSWEEKAFADDAEAFADDAAASGSLGGCIWPPRSYTCTFCKREFRSAQALGGHMNVHRRDRARLKQSPSPPNEVIPDHHQNHNNPDLQKPSTDQPKFPHHSSDDLDHNSTFQASRVIGLSTQENLSTATSSIVNQEVKGQLFGSDSCIATKRSLNYNNVVITSHSKPFVEAEKSIKLVDQEDSMSLGSNDDHVETNLSVGLNSVFFQNRPTGTCGDQDKIINYKRPKIALSTLPFIVSNKEKYSPLEWQVLGVNPARSDSIEDLDLELRLGVLQ